MGNGFCTDDLPQPWLTSRACPQLLKKRRAARDALKRVNEGDGGEEGAEEPLLVSPGAQTFGPRNLNT